MINSMGLAKHGLTYDNTILEIDNIHYSDIFQLENNSTNFLGPTNHCWTQVLSRARFMAILLENDSATFRFFSTIFTLIC